MLMNPGSKAERSAEDAAQASGESFDSKKEGVEVAEILAAVLELKQKLGLEGNASIDELAARIKVALGEMDESELEKAA